MHPATLSTVAACQMIQNEELAVEFLERPFHVFASIKLSILNIQLDVQ